jgi:hypothetical protein
MEHAMGQMGSFLVSHAPAVNGHRHGCHLVIGNGTRRKSFHKRLDLGASQFQTVSLVGNDPCGIVVHDRFDSCQSGGLRAVDVPEQKSS